MQKLKRVSFVVLAFGTWLGAEGCMFVHDSGCSTDQDCTNGNVCSAGDCVDFNGSDGEGATPGSGGSSAAAAVDERQLCEASFDAAAAKCGVSSQYRTASVNDCLSRAAKEPAACRDEYDKGIECEGSPSVWTCAVSEGAPEGAAQAHLSGCTEFSKALDTCLAANTGSTSSGGSGSGGASSAPTTCRASHSEASCADCDSTEYCEPGSSSSGIYCLPLCQTDADCCPSSSAIHCRQNTWTNSYVGTVCRTGS